MKLYTKTGDKGDTSLFGGKRVSKTDPTIKVMGEIDELSSAIGMAIAEIFNIKYPISNVKLELIKVQKDLFKISSILAGSKGLNPDQGSTLISERIKNFEETIDELGKDLPQLKNFILPGGSRGGSLLHFARSICRRVERKIVALSEKEKVGQNIPSYFNRLSDLLFTFARVINYKENQKEIKISGESS